MTIEEARRRLEAIGERIGFDAEIAHSTGDGIYEEIDMNTHLATPIPRSNPKQWRIANKGNSVEIVTIW